MTQNTIQINGEQKAKRRGIHWINAGILFLSLGVVVLLVMFYIAFSQLSDSMQKGFASAGNDIRDLNQRLQQLTDDMNKQAQTMVQLQGSHSVDWRVMQAEYLTKLASNQIEFIHNIPLAIKMLQAASRELETVADLSVQEIKKALVLDISRLQAVPLINTDQIYLNLLALDEKITQLPLPVMQVSQPNETKEDLSRLPWWKRGLHQTWLSLQKIIVVQHAEGNQKPLILPEQREALYQNLHAKLETAKWSLLHYQPSIYENSLKQTIQWIKRYFVQDAALTQSVLTNLDALQKINISPPAGSVADSLKAFSVYDAQQKKMN